MTFSELRSLEIYNEGLAKGRIQGRVLTYYENGRSIEEIAEKVGISVQEVKDLLEEDGLL